MLIQFDGVGLTYETPSGPRPVLRDVDLALAEHRIGIIGANGSGKSTALRMINGLLTPTAGRVLVDGGDTATDAGAIRRHTGFLFTNPDSQIIMPTVAEDVGFGLRKSNLPAAEREARVAEMLARFGLAGHRDHPAHLLSGGQKQLLALAAVLITEPNLILADEPTTLLDRRNAAGFRAILRDVDQQIVLATHHLELVSDFDRVICFDEQRVAADGAPDEVVAFYQRLIDAGSPA